MAKRAKVRQDTSNIRKALTKNDELLCKMWHKNPLINPETGRAITSTGPTARRYSKMCDVLAKNMRDKNIKYTRQELDPFLYPDLVGEVCKYY